MLRIISREDFQGIELESAAIAFAQCGHSKVHDSISLSIDNSF